MADEYLADVQLEMERTLAVSRMKGIAVGMARGDDTPEYLCLGTDAEGRSIVTDSLFPVASVTKLATALVVLRLVDQGVLVLDAPLARYTPDAVASGHPGVTLRRLLSHTSGLPTDLPVGSAPYALGLNWPILADACLRTPLRRQPCTLVRYSNVGYGLLAVAVERETDREFASVLDELVLKPLGIEGYLGALPARPAVTLSGVRGSHAKTELEPFNSDFWRSLAMPWAGLLTTVQGALSLVRAFTGMPEGFLRQETRVEATRNQAGELGGGLLKPLVWPRCPWGLGPEIHGEKAPHWAPAEASAESFGHSGASGCVAWADPAAGVAWAILGTRAADSGWLLHRGAAIGAAILSAFSVPSPRALR